MRNTRNNVPRFPKAKVFRTPEGDYLYRARVNRADVAKAISDHVLAIDYDNFKNSVHHDEVRHQAYLNVWCNMHSIQE